MPTATIRTPAKLNLGLEILRRRPDGYHDLATIFQAITIYDEFTVSESETLIFRNEAAIPPESDVSRRAFFDLGNRLGWRGRVTLRKSIPIAAGLGGGSSDAAVPLRLAGLQEPHLNLLEHAAALGADVPFFLGGGTALGTGTGDRLEPLPTPPWWFVVLVPEVRIERKTAALFAGLRQDDFTDGARVAAFAAALRARPAGLPAELPNAFERQMLEYPAVAREYQRLASVAGHAALSGAGPALFSWHASEDAALEVAAKLRAGTDASISVARALGPHGDENELRAFLRVLVGGGGAGTNGQ